MTHKDYLKQIGIEMKVARVRKSLSTPMLAKSVGMTQGTINGIEKGKLDAHILTYKRIADALGISLKDVL